MDWRNDRSKLKIKAHQILSTVKPAMRLSAKRIMIAFIMSKNRPSVIMVTGRVSIIKMGFTIKFKRLSTMATIIAVV